jgi:hypothetical protein
MVFLHAVMTYTPWNCEDLNAALCQVAESVALQFERDEGGGGMKGYVCKLPKAQAFYKLAVEPGTEWAAYQLERKRLSLSDCKGAPQKNEAEVIWEGLRKQYGDWLILQKQQKSANAIAGLELQKAGNGRLTLPNDNDPAHRNDVLLQVTGMAGHKRKEADLTARLDAGFTASAGAGAVGAEKQTPIKRQSLEEVAVSFLSRVDAPATPNKAALTQTITATFIMLKDAGIMNGSKAEYDEYLEKELAKAL